MQLTHVYIGANSSIRRGMVTDALGDDLTDVKITSTRPAFQSFRVVTQRNPALWDRNPELWEVRQRHELSLNFGIDEFDSHHLLAPPSD